MGLARGGPAIDRSRLPEMTSERQSNKDLQSRRKESSLNNTIEARKLTCRRGTIRRAASTVKHLGEPVRCVGPKGNRQTRIEPELAEAGHWRLAWQAGRQRNSVLRTNK